MNFRHAHGRLVSILSRRFASSPIEHCEDAAQTALLRAVETWPRAGAPEDPAAWLYRVAHHAMLDTIRAQKRRPPEEAEAFAEPEAVYLASEVRDDLLRMLFWCADPGIPVDSQIALALKTLCGFSTEEIALRFFQSPDAIHKRLQRARAQLRTRHDPLVEAARVPAILQMLYLLFNEGYGSAKPDSLIRRELCEEAIRLTLALADHPIGALAETDALLALMHLHASRFDARFDSVGGLLLLKEQDRSRWDTSLIATGMTFLQRSARGERFSRFHVEAAIAADHALATSYDATPWEDIASLYAQLERISPSPLNRLNRAIAIAEWKGAQAGIEALGDETPLPYYLWDATSGELYRRIGNTERARFHLARAIETAPTQSERALLEKRLQNAASSDTSPVTPT